MNRKIRTNINSKREDESHQLGAQSSKVKALKTARVITLPESRLVVDFHPVGYEVEFFFKKDKNET